jgi:hypothetical protein
MENYLIDTCKVWRREGPLVTKVAETAGIDLEEEVDKQRYRKS